MSRAAARDAGPALGRLTRRREFLSVAKGRSVRRRSLVLQARARDPKTGPPRFGFTASRKVGSAVTRNRAKRRLREVVRAVAPGLAQTGVDYVVIARAETATLDWTTLMNDFQQALRIIANAPPADRVG